MFRNQPGTKKEIYSHPPIPAQISTRSDHKSSRAGLDISLVSISQNFLAGRTAIMGKLDKAAGRKGPCDKPLARRTLFATMIVVLGGVVGGAPLPAHILDSQRDPSPISYRKLPFPSSIIPTSAECNTDLPNPFGLLVQPDTVLPVIGRHILTTPIGTKSERLALSKS